MSVDQYVAKLIVAGAGGVGKTAMVHRYVHKTFLTDHKMTIGAQFYNKSIEISQHALSMRIWDFAGEKRFRFILGEYCRGASGALVCFDITDYETFRQIPEWLQIIKDNVPDIPVLLVGTKYDLGKHQVPYDIADTYAKDAGCVGVAFTSSKTGDNVAETFESIGKWMLDYLLSKGKTHPGRE